MKQVYNKDGGYTKEASELDIRVRKMMATLIRDELEAGTPIEALEYVICSSVRTEILKQSIEIRIGVKTTTEKQPEDLREEKDLTYKVGVHEKVYTIQADTVAEAKMLACDKYYGETGVEANTPTECIILNAQYNK